MSTLHDTLQKLDDAETAMRHETYVEKRQKEKFFSIMFQKLHEYKNIIKEHYHLESKSSQDEKEKHRQEYIQNFPNFSQILAYIQKHQREFEIFCQKKNPEIEKNPLVSDLNSVFTYLFDKDFNHYFMHVGMKNEYEKQRNSSWCTIS